MIVAWETTPFAESMTPRAILPLEQIQYRLHDILKSTFISCFMRGYENSFAQLVRQDTAEESASEMQLQMQQFDWQVIAAKHNDSSNRTLEIFTDLKVHALLSNFRWGLKPN